MLPISGVQGFRDRLGAELGVSDWYRITQDEIDAFAAATGDRGRIHATGPGVRGAVALSVLLHRSGEPQRLAD